ncbi:sigma-70 family RNA polymerase sigma factor [Rhizobium paknamense]|uniref:sigma-70 family RNA polymerase sigma factor n=1 Tax=Rhizobium paknamense TaxID=1206817 RepID=UPI0027D843C2|nr:sigma-70 family RNA polymerase sigma factor [Rhizobium paknamense]
MDKKTRKFDVIGQLGALRRYALSLVRDREDAEDLVNEALVRALEKEGSFRRDGNLRSWLFSILHNAHIDRLRRKKRLARHEEGGLETADAPLGPGQEHAVRLAQIRRAFQHLPEEQRQVLHLVAIEDLSYEEAAQILGVPVGTLMSRLSRARARLRDMEDGKVSVPTLRLVGGSDEQAE